MLGFDALARLALGQVTRGRASWTAQIEQSETWTERTAQDETWTERTQQSETWTES